MTLPLRREAIDPSPGSGPMSAPARPAPAIPGRPRLLILTVGFGVGGAEQLILTTAPRLQRDGFEVTVACLGAWGVLGDELEARGVRALAFGARRPWDLRALGRLLSVLKRDRIQILRGHLFWANLAARFAGRLASVPVVVTTHHDSFDWMRWPHRLAERLTAPFSDAVATCSESVRREAMERLGLGPGRVRTLRNAIEISDAGPDPVDRAAVRRELGAGHTDILVGTLGRLDEPKKGLAVFLRAATMLARDEARARFAIVGDGRARADLERQAAREGIGHRTVFAGLRRDVPRVLRAFDLFVQPSLWEGFGLTVVEAMAAGLPVVASRVGGIPEAVEDGRTGLLVPPNDPGALAAACRRVLGDPDLAARLGRAGAVRARAEFGIDRLVRDIEALYVELLEEIPRRAAAQRRSGG